MTVKITKVAAGWYASDDGKWAVVHEGHGYVNQAEQFYGDGNDGWGVAYDWEGRLRTAHNAGENIDWADTLREGKAIVQREAAKRA